jgi:hypothetical protein
LECGASSVSRLQHLAIGPDLRLGGASFGSKHAYNWPFVAANLDGVADIEPGELPGGARSHNYFVFTRLKTPALHDLKFLTNAERGWFHSAKRNIRIGARTAFRQIDDHE